MNRQTIERAAIEFAQIHYLDKYGNLPEDIPHKVFEDLVVSIAYMFIYGAHWRINSVWHKPCDIAEPGKDCLVEHMDGDGNVCLRIDWRSEYEWVNACHYDRILRWAYVADLLPDRKEGGKR